MPPTARPELERSREGRRALLYHVAEVQHPLPATARVAVVEREVLLPRDRVVQVVESDIYENDLARIDSRRFNCQLVVRSREIVAVVPNEGRVGR